MAAHFLLAAADEPTPVGIVANADAGFQERIPGGEWGKVTKYQVVYRESEIRCVLDDASGSLTVRYFGAGETEDVPCTKDREKLWTPKASESKSFTGRLLFAMQVLLGSRPDFYELALSRGTEELVDAVGIVSGDQLDIGPALAELSPGVYFVRLCRVEPNPDPCAGPVNPIQVEWAGGSALVEAPAGEHHVALYNVQRFRRERRWRLETDESWLLAVASGGDHAARFEEFKAASESVAETYGPGGLRALRRTYLHSLAAGSDGASR